MTGDKEPDPIQKLRAAVDQSSMHMRELVPLLGSLYGECVKQGIDEHCASCLVQIYFSFLLRPTPYFGSMDIGE